MPSEKGREMKLFVWEKPYTVSYGHSMVFAIAETVEEAREQAKIGKSYCFGYEQIGIPGAELGEPTRIVDLPAAEWHRWEE